MNSPVYYRLYTTHAPVASRFALDVNHSNLSAIDANLLTPPYTVANIARFILERENVHDKAGQVMVYIDHKDANPASGATIIDMIDSPSTKAIKAILCLDLEIQLQLSLMFPTAAVSEEKVGGWHASGKYLHEHTKEPVVYLPFSPGDKLTTDLARHRLGESAVFTLNRLVETLGWKDVWKVANVANGKVGYVEAYERQLFHPDEGRWRCSETNTMVKCRLSSTDPTVIMQVRPMKSNKLRVHPMGVTHMLGAMKGPRMFDGVHRAASRKLDIFENSNTW
ncbi:hypothetical protein C8R45DRAFT_944654 [Mycena sanguinolenta]|nr:hypothetical protein C8R45DRAFT_944654 [Mycena sanguinolenta]